MSRLERAQGVVKVSVMARVLLTIFYGAYRLSPTLLIVSLLINSSFSHEWDSTDQPSPVCKLQRCQEKANQMAEGMNRNVEPCDDFFVYACGNWDTWLRSDTLVDENTRMMDQIRAVLESEEEDENESEEEAIARNWHEACSDIPWLGLIEIDQIKTITKNVSDWPVFNPDKDSKGYSWMDVHNYYVKLNGKSPFFDSIVRTAPDSVDAILEIAPPKSFFGRILRTDWSDEMENKFIELGERLFDSVRPYDVQVTKESLVTAVRDVFYLRMQLMSAIPEIDESEEKEVTDENGEKRENFIFYPTSIQKLKRLIQSNLDEGAEMFDLVAFIRSLYANNDEIASTIDEETVVNIPDWEYFIYLANEFANAGDSIIENNIHLYFLERHLAYPYDIYKIEYSLISGKSGSQVQNTPRWRECINRNPMQRGISQMYVKKYLPESRQKAIRELFGDLKTAIKQQISESSWLDKKTMDIAKESVDKLRETVDHEEIRETYGFDIVNPITPNAFFVNTDHYVYLTGTLANLKCDPNLPTTVNAAICGSTLGHELYHAFDEGSFLDSHGELQYLLNNSIYEKNSQCFLDQYNTYKMKELEPLGEFAKVDGNRTRWENIADTMGLKAAYQAYKRKVWEDKMAPTLPKFQNLTDDQLFFLSYASTMCEPKTSINAIQSIASKDTHCINHIRVIGTLSNMKEFSTAYNCPVGSPMNPKKKCDIWQ